MLSSFKWPNSFGHVAKNAAWEVIERFHLAQMAALAGQFAHFFMFHNTIEPYDKR